MLELLQGFESLHVHDAATIIHKIFETNSSFYMK